MSQRAARGDAQAFAMLVGQYERALRGFLARAFGPEWADDVAQDAFLKAWRAAGQYDGRARYLTWLTKIAWRCRLDALRAERPTIEAEAQAARAAPSDEIDDMLGRLSENERAALILCDGHGWSHGEAAGLLGLPLGTVKSTIARAKAKCRAMWEGDGHG